MQNKQIYAMLQQAYFSDHPDEEDVLACLPALLQGVRHFVDIGASLGQFTFHASKVMLGGRLDAFEADPIRAPSCAAPQTIRFALSDACVLY